VLVEEDELGPWTRDPATGELLPHWDFDDEARRVVHLVRDPDTQAVRPWLAPWAWDEKMRRLATTLASPRCLRCEWLDDAARRGVAESCLVDAPALEAQLRDHSAPE
jgi:hypothetical protein